MADKIFAQGIRFERPKEGTPTWVKGKIGIKVDEFVEFCLKHKGTEDWINLDLKESKVGNKLYLELSTWKPVENPASSLQATTDKIYDDLDKPAGNIPF